MDDSIIAFSTLPLPQQLRGLLMTVSWLDIIDIIVVAIIFYNAYKLLENTRAITLVKGLLFLLAIAVFCSFIELHAFNWLLQKALTFLMVALPIIFQPELRRALGDLGQGRFFGNLDDVDEEKANAALTAIEVSVMKMSSDRTGALIVFEREMKLNDICDTGVIIDASITMELLLNVFFVNTPLHDGAAVVRGGRLHAAACILPLTKDYSLSTEFGTRHRAAIGMSEESDALVVVVSEETGTVSIAEKGHFIRRRLTREELHSYLTPIFLPKRRGMSFKDLKEMFRSWRKNK